MTPAMPSELENILESVGVIFGYSTIAVQV